MKWGLKVPENGGDGGNITTLSSKGVSFELFVEQPDKEGWGPELSNEQGGETIFEKKPPTHQASSRLGPQVRQEQGEIPIKKG